MAFPKNPKTGKYPFGFVYLDFTAGFTFNFEGSFQFDAQGNAFRDSTDYLKPTSSLKVRLGPNALSVYAIPNGMLKNLNVKPVPDWLGIYKQGEPDRNTVPVKVSIGKHLNTAGGYKEALVYLESAYKTEPHAPGLEFELTYSYNELKQYDKVIEILKSALVFAPNNPLFYRELGYAYMKSNDLDHAIITYMKGIDIAGQRDNEAKGEMAWNLAVIYRDKKNDPEEYKKWGKLAKGLLPVNSTIGQALKDVVF